MGKVMSNSNLMQYKSTGPLNAPVQWVLLAFPFIPVLYFYYLLLFSCLQTSKAHAIAVSEHYIVCGCTDGVVR